MNILNNKLEGVQSGLKKKAQLKIRQIVYKSLAPFALFSFLGSYFSADIFLFCYVCNLMNLHTAID